MIDPAYTDIHKYNFQLYISYTQEIHYHSCYTSANNKITRGTGKLHVVHTDCPNNPTFSTLFWSQPLNCTLYSPAQLFSLLRCTFQSCKNPSSPAKKKCSSPSNLFFSLFSPFLLLPLHPSLSTNSIKIGRAHV